MRIDDFTRFLTKEDEERLSKASQKAIAIYLLTKKRDKEENRVLLSCIASYLLIAFMVIAIVISFIALSKNSIIDESMIKSFVIKTLIFIVFIIILDIFVVGKRWYAYLKMTKDNIRKEINNKLKDF